MTDRQCSTTPCITISLGQDHTGQGQRFIERLGGIYRILASHGIDNKQRFLGRNRLMQCLNFRHHRFIDGKAACSID